MDESASARAARRDFPPGFVWGSATSSYQVEGAPTADGKGESIWDRFCSTPGKIADGSDGSIACDHYHRYRDDVALMHALGLSAYRFSISWPRVVPDGAGAVNGAGLDFYDRLVDTLLEHDVTPYPTLYHWDLPQVLEDRGGWPSRDTAYAFADYARAVVERLGDRVERWATINEPYVIANLGYLTGEHAPGRCDLAASLAASHHLLLAHGLAVEAIRATRPTAKAGIVINFTPVTPVGQSPLAVDRQRVVDEYENRWYTDAIAGFGYPRYAVERLGWDEREVLDGDMGLIAAPVDFVGINYYTRQMVGALSGERPGLGDTTAMGWEIHPETLGELLRTVHSRYAFPQLFVTENGAAMPDTEVVDARVADHDRIAYLAAHLDEVREAIADGVPVDGYFAWSLLDNFEWAYGYQHKFGLVSVDLETQQRTPKASAIWYSGVAKANSLDTTPER